MRKRNDSEQIETQVLAPFAMLAKDSAGREFPEVISEVRTCYQRDRDRIVHSEAFRKLEYKTQVFVIFEGDYYRTRLTHTMEVSQIARTIGRGLRLNEDLIEAIALAHDLGHPPFGHAGEAALDHILQDSGLGNFNHNFRSFEIVTQEKRYPEFDGLNLSQEVLVGILKHETIFDKCNHIKKYGNVGPTLEAKVVDIADSLAYLSHDIDDGLTSGCITGAELMDSALWSRMSRYIDGILQEKDERMLRYQMVKTLIDWQIKDLFDFSDERLNELQFKSADEAKSYCQNNESGVIDFSPSMKLEREFLQSLLSEKLYHHYRVERMTSKASRVVQDLFDVYCKNPNQLPYEVYPRDKNFEDKEKYNIICNHIASMTDRFALDEHKKLFSPYQKV